MWYASYTNKDNKIKYRTLESLLTAWVTDEFISTYINNMYRDANMCDTVGIPYYSIVHIGDVTVNYMRGIGNLYKLKDSIIKELTVKIYNDLKTPTGSVTLNDCVTITRDSAGDEPTEPSEDDGDDDDFDAEEWDMIRNGCPCRCVGCDYVEYNDENNKFYCTAVHSETKDICHCPFN